MHSPGCPTVPIALRIVFFSLLAIVPALAAFLKLSQSLAL